MNTIMHPQVSGKLRKKDKYLPPEVVKKLYETVDNIRDLAYIQYHAETGLRVREICGTNINNIEWKHCRTHTYDFKKDAWRMVYWPEFVGSTLRRWLEFRKARGIRGEMLFPFTEKTANRIIKRWCEEIGFRYADRVSSHWLRHTFIRLSRRAGRDIKAVQQNTGDTVQTILEWYEGLTDEEMGEEIEGKPLVK